eukprot:133169_1
MTDTMNYKTFNLAQLTKCYDHIICVHLFCLKSDERIKIQKYVCSIVGKCKHISNCLALKQHSSRKREETITQKQSKKQTLNVEIMNEDILLSCLNSLHCYLLHDGNTLYRQKRFSTNPLRFVDKIDDLIQFIYQNIKVKNMKFIANFIEWVKLEDYDWDSLYADIDCSFDEKNKSSNQSNIYLFLTQHKQKELFGLLHNEYIGKNSNINAINFGISVLNWFKYGDGPNHKTFNDEILNNKY